MDEAIYERVQAALAANNVERRGEGQEPLRASAARAAPLHGVRLRDVAVGDPAEREGASVLRLRERRRKRGWTSCPHPSLPAGRDRGRRRRADQGRRPRPRPARETLAQMRSIQKTRTPALTAERRRLDREVSRLRDRAGTRDQLAKIEARLVEVGEELAVLQGASIDRGTWPAPSPYSTRSGPACSRAEHERVIALLVERIDFDAGRETVAITFRPTGIRSLAEEIEQAAEVTA